MTTRITRICTDGTTAGIVRRSDEAPLRVKERPILFSGPMVRALLEGRKTQTRRVLAKQPPPGYDLRLLNGRGEWQCPYGRRGERLWVRETWARHCGSSGLSCVAYRGGGAKVILYEDEGEGDAVAIGQEIEIGGTGTPKWRPSIFMPRWASRLTLEITGVRVERVRDISEKDVEAEGFKKEGNLWQPMDSTNPIYAYELYWNLLNEERGFGWEGNPWVWVMEFRRIE